VLGVKILIKHIIILTWHLIPGKQTFYECIIFDGFVKSLEIVMPNLIRHPERIEFTGFRLSPE